MQYGILRFDEPKREVSRKIIHIDMDAFYASVEIRENPSLRGKPIVIARHPKDTYGRGVVTTASYEARKYGIRSAMPAQKAYELCPHAIFIPGRHSFYRQISEDIHEIFKRYTSLIERVSVDEAFLDVTDNHLGLSSATLLAQKIQHYIYEELKLTCSAGVSYNKFIAKLASDYRKPRGLTTIDPSQAQDFLWQLPIEEFYGVGKKTVERMYDLEIYNGKDLYQVSEYDLVQIFGKMGWSLYRKVRGIDDSPVINERDRKSCGKEHTFGRSLRQEEQVIQELRKLSKAVIQALKKHQSHGKTVVLKVRYDDFEMITKRKTFPNYIKEEEELFRVAQDIWDDVGNLERGVRLLGITLTGLDPILYENLKLPLWDT